MAKALVLSVFPARTETPKPPVKFFAQQLATATTVRECWAVMEAAQFEDQTTYLAAKLKIIQLTDSFQNCWSIFNCGEPVVKAAAQKKCDELIEGKIPGAGLEDLHGLYTYTLDKTSVVAQRIAGLIETFLQQDLEAATTLEACVLIKQKTPEQGTLRAKVAAKLDSILDQKLKDATTPEECLILFSVRGIDVQTKAWSRIMEFPLTFDELHQLWKKCHASKEHVEIHLKLAEKLFQLAETIPQLWQVYALGIPKQAKERSRIFIIKVLKKITEQSSGEKELREMLSKLMGPDPQIMNVRHEVFMKLIQLGGKSNLMVVLSHPLVTHIPQTQALQGLLPIYLSEVTAIETVYGCWKLYNSLPDSKIVDLVRTELSDKIEELLEPQVATATTEFECQSIVKMSPPNSAVALMAARKGERLRRKSLGEL